jgi:hypothetical protein
MALQPRRFIDWSQEADFVSGLREVEREIATLIAGDGTRVTKEKCGDLLHSTDYYSFWFCNLRPRQAGSWTVSNVYSFPWIFNFSASVQITPCVFAGCAFAPGIDAYRLAEDRVATLDLEYEPLRSKPAHSPARCAR